jgi:hypothetical protein
MAFIPEEEEQTQPQQTQPQPVTGGQPTTIGAGQPTIGSQTPQNDGTRRRKDSGMFTNIRKYVQANQPSAQKMAGAITSGMEAETGQIRSQLEQQQSKLAQQLAQGRANLQAQQEQAQQAIQQAGQLQAGQQLEAPQIQQFRQFATGESTIKPQTFDISAQKRAAQKVAERAREGLRSSQKADLLERTFGDKTQYTRGQRSLDELILAGSPEAGRHIQQTMAQQPAQLQADLQTAQQLAKQQTGQYLTDLEQAREATLGQIGAEQQALQADLERRQKVLNDLIGQYQAQRTTQMADVGGNVTGISTTGSGPIDPALLQSLGIQAPTIYGQQQLLVDPSQYLKTSLSGVATQDDLARANALAALAGRQQTILTDRGLVGRDEIADLNRALRSAQSEFQTQESASLAKLQDAINAYNAFKGANVKIMGKSPGDYSFGELLDTIKPMRYRGAFGSAVQPSLEPAFRELERAKEVRERLGIRGYQVSYGTRRNHFI